MTVIMKLEVTEEELDLIQDACWSRQRTLKQIADDMLHDKRYDSGMVSFADQTAQAYTPIIEKIQRLKRGT